VRPINIDQTLRSDVASYELCCAYRYDDAVIACDDIITYGYNSARYNNALLEPAALTAAIIINLHKKKRTSLVNRTRWIGSGGKRVFRELSRGCCFHYTGSPRNDGGTIVIDFLIINAVLAGALG